MVPAPVIVFGVQATPEMAVGGLTVSWAVTLPPRVAVRVAEVVLATVPAVAVKLAVVEFWGTTTLAGTVTEPEEEPRVTVEPPAGAAVERVTVQAAWAPEARVVGVQLRAETTAGAFKATVAVEEEAPRVAVTTAL